ncbi:putative alpha-1,3-mannosyltransferase MNN14 [Fusarium oxysporum f. sp. albedinis]|nr:putative alpha-1,3-mannosyltransferase MNN14 [Fusarium oxysporum f. sp. albedinis]
MYGPVLQLVLKQGVSNDKVGRPAGSSLVHTIEAASSFPERRLGRKFDRRPFDRRNSVTAVLHKATCD